MRAAAEACDDVGFRQQAQGLLADHLSGDVDTHPETAGQFALVGIQRLIVRIPYPLFGLDAESKLFSGDRAAIDSGEILSTWPEVENIAADKIVGLDTHPGKATTGSDANYPVEIE